MSSESLIEPQFLALIAEEVSCLVHQIVATDKLLAEGSTVPFIARYRKEATGNLLDEQLEKIAKLRDYYIELANRRDAILESIASQDKLTDELEAAIRNAVTKQELEDLYLPYKPKRRTRAQIAKEKGLEPLADLLLENASSQINPEDLTASFIDEEKGVKDESEALAGAKDILAERLSESADNRASLRNTMLSTAILKSQVLMGQEEEGSDYQDYFDFDQLAQGIPSHRLLAILRGEREGYLMSSLSIEDEIETQRLINTWNVTTDSPCGKLIVEATEDGYKRLLRPSISNEVRSELQEQAEAEAIKVFRENLKALLMQAPFGQRAVMGLDPGIRTGCKLAVVNGTGRVEETGVIYLLGNNTIEASEKIKDAIEKYNIVAVAIGNGTASRETEQFVKAEVKKLGLLNIIIAIVPETGASVYSASEVARKEFPNMDVALRGAVSIARRLQDPLAELVKIEPRSLGVGQYQHDVNQKTLSKELDITVEGVVNAVGVELNSASASLLRRISGLSERIANNIVNYRDENGAFSSRKSLLKIKGLGPKTFEQSAGFLRIRDAEYPLDATAVHPERYSLVENMAQQLNVTLNELVGNPELSRKLNLENFIDEEKGVGTYTLKDIVDELTRPGRDPRPEFEIPKWRDDVQTIEDLKEGMTLEGRVSNVANFGAFVDIGLKQDGLIHVSELSNQWVDDPRKVVQVGKIVKVQVIEIDIKRGRVSLSMKSLEAAPHNTHQPGHKKPARSKGFKKKKAVKKDQGFTMNDLMNKFNN